MDMTNLIDVLLGCIITGSAWFIIQLNSEIKRLQILINKTREEYATKFELRDDMNRVMEALHRVEDKLDKILSERK